MLFLAKHVRSKKYEVETDFNSDSKNSDSDDDDNSRQWIMEENDVYNNDLNEENVSYQYISDEDGEKVEVAEIIEDEEVMQSEYIEDEYEDVEELTTLDTSTATEEADETQQMWLKNETPKPVINVISSRKRRASSSGDFQDQPKSKIKSESTLSDANMREEQDEDMAFGNTIGCMLKKIPKNLKTAVKLKLLSSLAEFEAQYNLS